VISYARWTVLWDVAGPSVWFGLDTKDMFIDCHKVAHSIK